MAGTSTDPVTVNILNDDCLFHVFSFLSTRESIKIERVCKRWQKVLKIMGWRSIRADRDEIKEILEKCGNNVTDLCIQAYTNTGHRNPSHYDFSPVKEAFDLIDANCKKLLHLDFHSDLFDITILNVEKYNFYKLKSLTISEVENNFDDKVLFETIMSLFDKVKNLEKFSCTDKIKKKVHMDYTKKEVELSRFHHKLEYGRLFNRFPGVKDLTLSFFGFFDEVLSSISDQLNSLTLIYYPYDCFYYPYGKGQNWYKKWPFSNLKILTLDQHLSGLTNEVFATLIEKSPKLTELHMTYCYLRNVESYRHLQELQGLTVFHVNAEQITGEILEYLSENCKTLEKIDCPQMQGIRASNLKNIVANLPNLKYLKVQGFRKLKRRCFKSVLKTVERRTNCTNLDIEFEEQLENEQVWKAFKLKEIQKPSSKLKNGLLTIRLNIRGLNPSGTTSFTQTDEFSPMKVVRFFRVK